MEKGLLLEKYKPSPMEKKRVLHPLLVDTGLTWQEICSAKNSQYQRAYWLEMHIHPISLMEGYSVIRMTIQERYNLLIEIVQVLEYAWNKPVYSCWHGWTMNSEEDRKWKELLKNMSRHMVFLEEDFLKNMNEATLQANKADSGHQLIIDLIDKVNELKSIMK